MNSILRKASFHPNLEQLEGLTLLSVSSSISGTVFNDLAGNGIRAPGDPGVAGETVFLEQNNKTFSTVTIAAPSTAISQAPGQLGAVAGGDASTLPVAGFSAKISDLQVNMDLANNGSSPVIVGIASPLGLTVPNLPTLFEIQPGEHFVGSFDAGATNPVTLAARPLAPGTYQPQQSFTDPQAHIYDGNPNGTWALVFFGDTSGLVLSNWSLTFKLPEPSTTTDASGDYSFTGLATGTYQVEVAPDQAAGKTVQVGAGQALTGVDLGVQPASLLSTQSFYLSANPTAWGQDVTVNYTLANQGEGDAPAFNVSLVLSANGTITTSDPVLQSLHVNGLAAHATLSGSLPVALPATPPAGFGPLTSTVIGFLIDPDHDLPHNNAADSANQGLGVDSAALAIAPNLAITSGSAIQQDPSIAVDPNNPNHLVVAYMDNSLVSTGYAGIGVEESNDGGSTWQNSVIPLPAGFDQGAADPTVQFDGSGNVFVSFMAATFLGPNKPGLTEPDSTERSDGFTSNNGIFVARSSDGGLTWGSPVAVVAHTYAGAPVLFEDAPNFAVDTFKTLPKGQPNPDFGNLYVTWARVYPAGQFPGDSSSTGGTDVMIAVSSDGGKTWTTQLQTQPGTGLTVSVIEDPGNTGSDPAGHGFMFYPHVTVGPEGDIYVGAFAGGAFTVYHSFDAGASFQAPDYADQLGIPFSVALPTSTLFADNFRTDPVRDIVADPSQPGLVYVTEANSVYNVAVGGTIGPGDILFASSNDYGQTWNPQFQVGQETTNLSTLPPGEDDSFLSVLNDDDQGNFLEYDTIQQLNNEAIDAQALPAMAVDAQGQLTVIWYDTRRDPFQQNLDVFGTVSSDGGQTFSPNFRVSDTSFNPNNGVFTDANGNPNAYLGDQLGVAAANGVAYAVWTDTRNGGQQIEFSRYSLNQVPAAPLDRLYPNTTPASATSLGEVLAQQILPKLVVGPGDDNWFSLQAGANGNLVVTATATSGGAIPHLQLTDPDGNPLTAVVTSILDASGAVIGTKLVYQSLSGEDVLAHVSAGAETGYTFTIESYTVNFGTSLEGAATGAVAPGQQDVYSLDPGVSGSISLTLTPGDDVQDGLEINVFLADGQPIAGPVQGTFSVPVTQGQGILIVVSGVDTDAQGSFSIAYTNLDQYETNGVSTLFFPTTGQPASIAVAKLAGPNSNPDIIVSSTDISDPVSVLAGNGDGTFQAPRQYDVGPGLNGALTAGNRQVAVADFNNDGVPDIAVPNFRAGDVSVLLGNGDGTFQPQRTFDAVASPDSMVTDDFTGDGNQDIAVLQNFPQFGGVSDLAILIGRGDGTFKPAVLYPTIFGDGAGPMVTGDFTGNGKQDIIIFSKNAPEAELFLNNGDGTFTAGGIIQTGENVFNAAAVDLDGDGHLDLVTTGTNSGNVYLLMGNGDGTFQPPIPFAAMSPGPGDNVGVYGLAVVDFGSENSDGSLGPPDGLLDIVVTAQDRSGVGAAQVIMLPGLVDSSGNFNGFGSPITLAQVGQAGNIAVGDFTNDGTTDLAVTDTGGVTVIYGQPLTVPTNATPQTARNLGSVAHLVTAPQAIVSDHEDAYLTYTVPTEAAVGSGAEVVDVSSLFQDVGGAGLDTIVTDAQGHVLGTGDRFRVLASQGEVLTIHVFGLPGSGGSLGDGLYTLDIDVLPQVISAEAESVVPGGPATSIVLTLQGDRLNPTAAQNPANYTVLWLKPDGQGGTIPTPITPTGVGGGLPILYDPSANLDVASGLTYQTAVRQTVTLLFATPLPAGSYEIVLSPNIQAASYSSGESALLASEGSFGEHPVASVVNGTIVGGSELFVTNLVAPAATTSSNLSAISKGTPFLSQLPTDLSALLDELLAQLGDDPSITATINQEILSRFAPSVAAESASKTPLSFAILWFDPVSIDLESSQGQGVSYNLGTNALTSGLSQTYVSVGGNVEMVVMANVAGTFNLDVANVPETARGGAVVVNPGASESFSFTDALRGGETAFSLELTDNSDGSTPDTPTTTTITSTSNESATGSTALIAGPASQGFASLSAAPSGSGSSSSSGSAGSPGGAGQSFLQSLRQASTDNSEGQDSTNLGRLIKTVSNALDEALADWLDAGGSVGASSYARGALQALKAASTVKKALGYKGKPAADLVWNGLMNILDRLDHPAVIASGNRPQPPKFGRGVPGRGFIPSAIWTPLPGPRNLRRDEAFLPGRDIPFGAAVGGDATPGAAIAWTALLLPTIVYEARSNPPEESPSDDEPDPPRRRPLD